GAPAPRRREVAPVRSAQGDDEQERTKAERGSHKRLPTRGREPAVLTEGRLDTRQSRHGRHTQDPRTAAVKSAPPTRARTGRGYSHEERVQVQRAELILETTDPSPDLAGLLVRPTHRRTRLLLWLGEGSWDTLRRRLLG